MKKTFILLLATLSLFAKESAYLHELSFLIGNSENGLSSNINRSLAYELQYQYNGFDFPLRPELSLVHSPTITLYSGGSTSYTTMMANGVYEIPYAKRATPYLKAGVGYTLSENTPGSPDSSLLLDAGAGLKIHLSDQIDLKVQVMFLQEKDRSNILATGGLSYAFGNKGAETIKSRAPSEEKRMTATAENRPQTPSLQAVPSTLTADTQQAHSPQEDLARLRPTKEPAPLNIEFPFATARLTEASRSSIKAYAAELNLEGNRKKKVLIVGHTDAKGSRAFNATLSMRRASAVYAALITNGIDPKRISIDGYGETRPVADNETERGREQNRRVRVSVTAD
jgi:OOP family OmpA-OmpF porin